MRLKKGIYKAYQNLVFGYSKIFRFGSFLITFVGNNFRRIDQSEQIREIMWGIKFFFVTVPVHTKVDV